MRRGIKRSAGLGVVLLTASLLLLMGPAFAADGDLDRSFSGDGKQTTNLGGAEFAEDVAIQPNGKIVVLVPGGPGSPLARYNPDGSLDPTFSANGIVSARFGGEPGQAESASSLALQGAKIVVAGTTGQFEGSGKYEFAVSRFTRDGLRDRSFAGDGTRTFSFGRRRTFASGAIAVAIDDQRRIVVAGSQNHSGEGGYSFDVARLTPDGALDRSFSRDGKQSTSFRGCDIAESVAVTRNGGVVVVGNVGYCRAIDATAWGIARYRPDGRLDRSFAGDGRLFGPRDIGDGRAADVATSGGRIVVAGTRNGHFALVRYRRDGTPDRTFSGDGRQITGVHPEFPDIASDLAIESGGESWSRGAAF